MNKTELIEHIAKHADISKAAATRALESTIGAVKTTGRNPRTGEAITIKAAKVPKFRPGKGLKDALN